MIAFYIILVAVLIILAVTLYFFSIAFVRRQGGIQDGFESAESKFLAPHKNEIIKGIEYIKSLDGEECTVTSFDGLRLYGRFYKKDNARGTAIIFHGYRSDARRDFCCEFNYRHGARIRRLFRRGNFFNVDGVRPYTY